MPPSCEEFGAYLRRMYGQLQVGEEARRIAYDVLHPRVPPGLGLGAPALRVLTAGLLPPPLRASFGLEWGGRERLLFAALTRAVRTTLPALPASTRFWPHYRSAEQRVAQAGDA